MRQNFRLATVFGIPIGINFSWFLALAFVVGLLATGVFPQAFPSHARWVLWLLALTTGLIFFASILLHEVAHSLIARLFGIPVRSITLFIFGGIAQITKEASRSWQELVMAAAGPATSILLSGFFLGLWQAGGRADTPVSLMWQWLWLINLGVGIFNMAPAFPMDGGRVLRSALWGITGNYYRSTRIAISMGRGFAYVLMAVGALMLLRVSFFGTFDPFEGLWLIIIGLFLDGAARSSGLQLRVQQALNKLPLRDVMQSGPPELAVDDTVAAALAEAYPPDDSRVHAVGQDARFVGLVSEHMLRSVPPDRRMATRVGDLALPASRIAPFSPQTDAFTALQEMETRETSVGAVVENGVVIGFVRREALLAAAGLGAATPPRRGR